MLESPRSIFLEFSNLLKVTEGGCNFGKLDKESQAILKIVANAERLGDELCISDVINESDTGSSPATLLKRVHGLRDRGWLVFEKSRLHHRRIRLRLSEHACEEFERLSDRLASLISAR
jgi:DNA-binding MarR family transcriptional regulator